MDLNDAKAPCRLAVIIASHNRREKTIRCLQSLMADKSPFDLSVYLFEDGSTDGTQQAVKDEFPQVQIIEGDGNFYWAGGMRTAWDIAIREGYDAYLLLNDDVQLDDDALCRIWKWSKALGPNCVTGGSMRGPGSQLATYGGLVRNGLSPLRFSLVPPSPTEPLDVDVLHGNCILVSKAVVDKIGGFASYLVHLGGDFDYSMRARRAGFTVKILPGTFGECAANPTKKKKRGIGGVKSLTSIKQMPLRVSIPFYRENCGRIWPVWLIISFVKAFFIGN